ncbi:MAG: PepSY domain-containing protein [Deltaproteobacteria bacterium]|nr:PepSY domain-containing protein [Nannocystaceae bacterium]
MASRAIAVRLSATLLAVCASACDPGTHGDDGPGDLPPGAEIDLLEAMAIAIADTPGSVVLDAELTEEPDGLIYDIDRYLDGETREIVIDPGSGKFLDDGFDPEDQPEGPEQAAALAGSATMVTLPGAVETAEARYDGKAVSVELDLEGNAIEVVLFRSDERPVVVIDLDDGSVRGVQDAPDEDD